MSAAVEWSKVEGAPGKWEDFWKDPDTKSYYFIGKDNIPFHSIVWPAMLMGYGGLNLPYNVPANEFLSLENRKFSTSQNWAVWVPDFLSRYDPDPLRYLLCANMPESGDSNFSWAEFVRRNTDELVATYGNLVNRVLTFTYKNFDGKIPAPGPLSEADQAQLKRAKETLETVDRNLYECHFKVAIGAAFSLAQEANRYLDQEAPWRSVRTEKDDAARTLWTSIAVINCLKTLLYPFLPFSSETLHTMLGLDGSVRDAGWSWDAQTVAAGQLLEDPVALFTKLEDTVVEEEAQRVGR